MSLEHLPNRDGQTNNLGPQHLTIRQFGELFGPRPTKTYELLKSGELQGKKLGRLTVIPYSEALRWSASLPAYRGA